MIAKVAVIILNWKQPRLTLDTVNSFLKINHSGFDYQIILIDNGSPDNSFKIFQKNFDKHPLVTLLQTGSNLGYVGGNNFGIKYGLKKKFDHFLIVNNDVLVDLQFLNILIKEIAKHPQSILAPKIYFAPGFEFHRDRYRQKDLGKVIWAMGGKIDWQNVYGSNLGIDEVDTGQYNRQPPKPDFISGCCFLVNRRFFQEVGLFDEKYYLYLEDADLSRRAVNLGYQLAVVPKSIIWHVNSGSSGAGSPLHDYFLTRNRLLFTFRYASLRTKFAVFRESLRHLITGRNWQKRGVIDFYLGRLGKGSWK
ncbi:MAG: glycosyltransferase family 2 protein [Patescibacteria group bacterium]